MIRQRVFPALLLALAILAGCGVSNVHRLTEENYKRKPRGAEIKLYVNRVLEPHVAIAQINSDAAAEDSPEARRDQLGDLQKRARALGADAVMNIRHLENKGRGFVPDARIPFSAFKQGNYKQSFLRGTAIVYVVEETTPTLVLDEPLQVEETDASAATGPMGIPTIETGDDRAEDSLPSAPETP